MAGGERADGSTRVLTAAKPTGSDEPDGLATNARVISRHEEPAQRSARGPGTERVSKGRSETGRTALSAGPSMPEDGLASGLPERGVPAGAVQHTRNTAGTTGRGPLRDDPDTGEAATDAADNDGRADALEANPMRSAGLEGLVPPGQRAVATDSVASDAVRSSAQDIGQVAGQVADRILVSMPTPGAPEEVRITLRDSVLEGSDVRISREAGEIRIVFVAQTESAQRLLAEHRGVFEQTLGESLQEERVHVAVEGPDSGDTSRGEGDGRSRQQYVPEDDGRPGDIET